VISLDNACYIPERLRDVSCIGAVQIDITSIPSPLSIIQLNGVYQAHEMIDKPENTYIKNR